MRTCLCTKNEVVIPKISDSENETQLLVSESDNSMVTEDDRLLSKLGSGQFREYQANHEGLN